MQNTVYFLLCLDDKNQYVLKAPKSYSGYRKIPIPDTVASALDEYRKENDTVISITPNSLTTRFHRLLVKMNMPHFTFHNLRHYNASIMLALNIPNKYAMEFMGWLFAKYCLLLLRWEYIHLAFLFVEE